MVFEQSSGNVFADLGLPDARGLLLKADLMRTIASEIRDRKMTQAQASKITGIAQADLSRIGSGKTFRYSIERLVYVLKKLGRDVEIQVLPRGNAISSKHTRKRG